MADTTKVTVTMKEQTLDWLHENYPDATSDSQAVMMAISDARDFQTLIKNKDTFIQGNINE